MTLADALAVCTQARQADRDCLHAVTNIGDPEQYALMHYQSEGAAWTLLDGDTPVAIGGAKLPAPWLGVVWIVCTDRMTLKQWKKLVRHGRIVLNNAAAQLRRVECFVLSTWPQAEVFARRMGFELEGTRYGAGRNGEDILTFVYKGN